MRAAPIARLPKVKALATVIIAIARTGSDDPNTRSDSQGLVAINTRPPRCRVRGGLQDSGASRPEVLEESSTYVSVMNASRAGFYQMFGVNLVTILMVERARPGATWLPLLGVGTIVPASARIGAAMPIG